MVPHLRIKRSLARYKGAYVSDESGNSKLEPMRGIEPRSQPYEGRASPAMLRGRTPRCAQPVVLAADTRAIVLGFPGVSRTLASAFRKRCARSAGGEIGAEGRTRTCFLLLTKELRGLSRHSGLVWSVRRDSHSRDLRWQRSAWLLGYERIYLDTRAGIEPASPGLQPVTSPLCHRVLG